MNSNICHRVFQNHRKNKRGLTRKSKPKQHSLICCPGWYLLSSEGTKLHHSAHAKKELLTRKAEIGKTGLTLLPLR